MKTRTSLQYNPHALQFNSSFRPRLHNGVCVAPQLEHSAFTPPGAELFETLLRKTAGFTLVAVAPGPEERVVRVAWVLTVKWGLPKGVEDLVLMRRPEVKLVLAEIV
jgi:hypothetical protein